jgi:hypothetical protein
MGRQSRIFPLSGDWQPGARPAEFEIPDESRSGVVLYNPDTLPNLRKAAGLPPADLAGIALPHPRPPAGSFSFPPWPGGPPAR